ncbi:hypothetical protein [Corynebacterium macclintockiae]|uniref:hypothetical protein n=1 Tax=Corynebacterium macclintockiae TaxID=2913501 RepID=UPI003EBCEFDA
MELDFRSIEREGITITVVAPSGDMFVIADYRRPKQSVILLAEGFGEGDGTVEFTTHESVNRYGVRRTGWKVPAITGTLKVLVTSDEMELSQAFRRWRAAWSRFKPGKLRVEWRDGATSEIDVYLHDAPSLPSSFVGLRSMQDEIQWKSNGGVWTGSKQSYMGTFTKAFQGDLPPSLCLRWDGQATSFTLPSGMSVNLSKAPGERVINLDRGMQGQVTTPAGEVDSATWSALRGVLTGETLTPHQEYAFSLGSGLTLEVTPRFLSPWR